jgi:hypothetical protein
MRQTVYSWHDFYLGLIMEQGRSNKNEKGKKQVGKTPMRSNTDILFEVRLAHSSKETFVMKVERRG